MIPAILVLLNNSTTRKCFNCGSDLILISKTVERLEGCQFPQTTIVYHCSNVVCQKEMDDQAVKRAKQREEKILLDQKRAEQRQALKKPFLE